MNLDFNKPVKCPLCGKPTAILDSVVSESYSEPFVFRVKCCSCGSTYDLSRQEFEKISLPKQNDIEEKKEAIMQVTYNGFTGELVKLERKATQIISYKQDEMKTKTFFMEPDFNLTIYDSGKGEIRAFSCVKLADVKFIGGTATMSGKINIGEVSFG